MSIIETIKEFLAPSSPAMKVITVSSPVDYDAVPFGFFNVRTSVRTSLGYRGVNFMSYQVGETIVDGGKRVTLSVPRSELPTVVLDFQRPSQAQDGAQFIAGCTVLDTDSLEQEQTVTWAGSKVRNGVEWV